MARKQIRGGPVPVIRRNQPEVKVAEYTVGDKLPTMIVKVRNTGRRFKLLMGMVKWGNFGIEDVGDTEGTYVVSGLPDKLMEFFHQWWVEDAYWDHNAKVFGGSGHGGKEVVAKVQRGKAASRREKLLTNVPDAELAAEQLREQKRQDERHAATMNAKERAEAGIYPPAGPHGDETLDKLDMQRRKLGNEWWKQMGLSQPVNNIGPDGKAL